MDTSARRRFLASCLSAAVCVPVLFSPAFGAELRWNAKTLYERAMTSHVRLSSAGTHIELQRGVLHEDDGPAAGFSYRPNVEALRPGVLVRKQLVVDNPAAAKATLLVARGGALTCDINGRRVPLGEPRKCGNYWQAYDVPASALRRGLNDIVLGGRGQLWIARDDEFATGSRRRTRHPNRSAKSHDAGKTWNDRRLGTGGDIDGEYYVRLFLDQHRPRGKVLLPVLDVGNFAEKPIAPPIAAVGPVRIAVSGDAGKQGRFAIQVRSGSTFAPEAKHWSGWQPLGKDGILKNPRGRFLQIAVRLTTADPLSTPALTGISIRTESESANDWTGRLKVLRNDNPRIVRTSIPFEYEPFTHPRLAELRQRYKLDDVVRGAKSEFESITRLAKWSAGRWRKGHLREAYPPWDAVQILKTHRDGTPLGGFCQQYNVVFLQACESFGIVGRAVSLGPGNRTDRIRSGHEVVELWSKDYRKWIYVDGQHAHYAADASSGVPLSLLELHDRQLAAFARKGKQQPVRIVSLADSGSAWPGLTQKIPFLELRLIPRSSFLERQSPLPLNQGMRGWFWTGHYVWSDAALPARELYGNRVEKRGNWEWTLNQAHVVLEATRQDGVLRVHLDTVTPGFASFVATIDGAKPRTVSSGFLWALHPGQNRLRIHSRNTAGRDGIASEVVLANPIRSP